MRGFALGLVVGLAVGAGGTFVALKATSKDKAEAVATVDIDAGADDAQDKGKKRRKGRKGRRGRAGKGSGELQVIDERVQLTAADRKMVTKGPKVALPNQGVDFGAGGGGRSLTQSEINSGLSRGTQRMVGCIADARGNAEMSATITVKFLVGGDGRATKVQVRAPAYLHKHGVQGCIADVVRGLRFEATGGHTVVSLPLDLGI